MVKAAKKKTIRSDAKSPMLCRRNPKVNQVRVTLNQTKTDRNPELEPLTQIWTPERKWLVDKSKICSVTITEWRANHPRGNI
jgi:hypothetical protein